MECLIPPSTMSGLILELDVITRNIKNIKTMEGEVSPTILDGKNLQTSTKICIRLINLVYRLIELITAKVILNLIVDGQIIKCKIEILGKM